MRAKFVPAEALYPPTAPVMVAESKPMYPMSYAPAEYSMFPHNSASFLPPTFQPIESPFDQSMPLGDTFGMSDFVNKLTEEDTNPYARAFEYPEILARKTNGFTAKTAPKIPTFTSSTENKANGKSRFGFEYESLTESIDDLELTNSADKESKTKLDQAKFEIEIGNVIVAEKLLKEMLENNEIKYKDFVSFDNTAFLNAFTPISE